MTVRRMTKTDAAWLAGFFDGEGSYRSSHQGTELHIVNTCLPALERCREITGVGRIRTLRLPTARTKHLWQWVVSRIADTTEIRRQMAPFRWVLRKSEVTPG